MTVRLSGPSRRSLPRVDRSLLRRRASRLLAVLDRREEELSVVLLDDRGIAELNQRWRGRAGPTDVLSFSLLEGERPELRRGLLGDVVIGVETAAYRARRARRSLDDEIARLLIHGVLHLLGFDHEREDQARVMRAEEARLRRLVCA